MKTLKKNQCKAYALIGGWGLYLRYECEDLVLEDVELASSQETDLTGGAARQAHTLVLTCNQDLMFHCT